MLLGILAAALIGYLLGSLPFGYLVARAHGVDIFKVGSGNPGATNVKRVLGEPTGQTLYIETENSVYRLTFHGAPLVPMQVPNAGEATG